MKNHKFFDRPILGMILGLIVALFGIEILGYILGVVFKAFIANEQMASSLGLIIVSILWLFLHQFWFRNEIQHFFQTKALMPSLLLGWSAIFVPLATFILNLIGGSHPQHFVLALILALSAGTSEEVIFRIIPISIAMRAENKEKLIPITFVLTGILFGLIHSANVLVGADFVATILQVCYASAIGFVYAAIYMRTGNLWVTMILHTYTDFMGFLFMDVEKTGGIITESSSVATVLYLLVCALIFFANAYMIFKKENRKEIPVIWKSIWHKAK